VKTGHQEIQKVVSRSSMDPSVDAQPAKDAALGCHTKPETLGA
jgi:hypothetical protein